ncbi:MAG TPA: type 4a pilus biogenesis protein PilO [Pyrinomonadaceae bacterium]|nr:type 4a pilus biogenesis protein PilO [Pyrinomonadaceae bacterium]
MIKLEALQEKAWYVQVGLFGLVAVILSAGFWYFLTSGTRAETAEIQAKVEKLQQENAKAQIASQRLNEFKVAYARVQADYDDLKALLPEQRELTMVLQNVQDRARGHLTLMSFMPKEDVQQDFYTGKPIEVEVAGTYNNVGAFFASIASYQRIVSVTDFKVAQVKDQKEGDNKTINAKFLLTAYYASPEKLQNVTPAPAGAAAPGAAQPGQPASAAPALNGASSAAQAASQAPTATGAQPAAATK